MSERKLPMAENAPPAPVQVSTSSARMIVTLAIFGAAAGLCIVLAYGWANPRILANQAARLSASIMEVLGGAERYETIYLDGETFTREPQADTAGLDRVYVGYTADGQPRGVAMATPRGCPSAVYPTYTRSNPAVSAWGSRVRVSPSR